MNKKYYQQCIDQGRYRVFAGTEIILPQNGQLLEDLLPTIKRITADQKRITPTGISSGVHPVLQHTAKGVSLKFVFVPPPQSDFFDPTTWGCDEVILRTLDNSLAEISRRAVAGIEFGINFANKASRAAHDAEAVRAEFEKSEEPRIAREVAKRSKDKEVTVFELQPGPYQLGGEINVPLHYPSREDIILKGCKFHRWLGTTHALLESPTFEFDSRIKPCLAKGKLKIKFLADSPEELALDCAKISRTGFDVVVNLAEELSPQRTTCHLMSIVDEEAIIHSAKERIKARLLKLASKK